MDRNYSEEIDDNHPSYVRVSRAGRGAHGSVWLAHRRNAPHREVALKYVDAVPAMKRNLIREVSNHFKLCHPHIVMLHHVSYHNGSIVLELEAMRGGDMQQFMRRNCRHGFAEGIARWYFQQLVLAVEYCHMKFVCNRDIKLENILLTATPSAVNNMHPQIKLCDFGWSKDEAGDSAPHSRAGSPAYVAPEILTGLGKETYDGEAADAWSLGVVLYCLVLGRLPFTREEDEPLTKPAKMIAMTRRILAGEYHFPDTPSTALSPEIKDLISNLLHIDPGKRMRISRIMHHPWFFEPTHDSAVKQQTIRQFNSKVLENERGEEWQCKLKARMQEAEQVFAQVGWGGELVGAGRRQDDDDGDDVHAMSYE